MKKRLYHGFATILLTVAAAAMCAFPSMAFVSETMTTGSGPAADTENSYDRAAPDTTIKTTTVKITGPAGETSPGTGSSSGTRGSYLGEFTTTAYCSCSLCCSGGFSLTYSGTVPTANHTISADISRFPIGTRLMIGDTIYTVEDIGSAVTLNCLDIYFDSHEEALDYGRKTVDVYAVD